LSQNQSKAQLLSRERRPFLWRKLHSLTGIVPVGVFLLVHLWTNAKALQGQRAFDEAVAELGHLPYLVLIEILGIGLPLLIHAVLGVMIVLEMRSSPRRYPFSRHYMYLAQRLSGIVALAFIAYHLWQLRIQVALGTMDKADFFPELCSSLSATVGPGIPLMAIVYLLGVAASVFHFANGLYGFCFGWGITVSRRAARMATALFGLVGVILFVLGANTVVYFATGTRLTFSTQTSPEDAPPVSCQDLQPGASPTGASSKPAAH
jgi:succinate dehydrogenase/fumarate reductase cytochrome b subunit (b558 family)